MNSTDTKASRVLARIVEVCRQGNPVLFAGLGLSIESGYPTWPQALRELGGYLSDSTSVSEAIDAQDLDVLADTIASRLSQSQIRETLRSLYWTEKNTWSREWSSLRLLPFQNIITPGWDASVQRAFGFRNQLEVLSPSTKGKSDSLFTNRACLVRLHGDLANEQDEIILSNEQFRNALARNAAMSRSLASLITSHSHIFVGASPRTIVRYLRLAPPNPNQQFHFALLSDDSQLRLYRDLLTSCGVAIVPYKPVANARRQLLELITVDFGRRPQGYSITKPANYCATVENLKLNNIGVFEELDYSFEPGWNVILGNNGTGKSTLLKALAFGLASSDPAIGMWGKRLLSRGKSFGSIEVTLDGVVYRTEIVAQGHGTNVQVASPVEIGRAFALAYPALRGGPSENAHGPMRRIEKYWNSDDVMPLMQGSLDVRMGTMKQWIVNSAVRERLGQHHDSDSPPDTIPGFHIKLFEMLSELVPDAHVTFHSLDESDWSIKVVHRNQVVDLDDLSQGMSSMLGWIAHAFQRISQVLGVGPRVKNPAILIIDELDAHMHPEWQQALPAALSRLFSNDQFIVATHSPFLAIGRQGGEVKRIYRDPGSKKFDVHPVTADTTGWGVGIALTSHLFGLQSLLPKALEAAAVAKRVLSAKAKLTIEDVRKLQAADIQLQNAKAMSDFASSASSVEIQSTPSQADGKNVSSVTLPELESSSEALSEQEASDIVGDATRAKVEK